MTDDGGWWERKRAFTKMCSQENFNRWKTIHVTWHKIAFLLTFCWISFPRDRRKFSRFFLLEKKMGRTKAKISFIYFVAVGNLQFQFVAWYEQAYLYVYICWWCYFYRFCARYSFCNNCPVCMLKSKLFQRSDK